MIEAVVELKAAVVEVVVIVEEVVLETIQVKE